MDHKEEYHDPDYAGTIEIIKEEPPSLSEEERIEKIKKIIRREFSNELEVRENEVMQIDQKMSRSRRLLHRLRCALVGAYYREQRLQLSGAHAHDELAAARDSGERARAELSQLVRGQGRLHPSVRKLLGRRTADLSDILRGRTPRSHTRPDYSAMLQTRNYTIAADSTKSLRPAPPTPTVPRTPSAAPPTPPAAPPAPAAPRRVPRHVEPRAAAAVTLDESSRNKVKHRYRIVIGNTSKYAPPASRADRSTHKWLLYVRDYRPPTATTATTTAATTATAGRGGGGSEEGIGAIVKSVTARLHHSYAPHHTVTLHKPPFHISRRGWGEFPARLQLSFALPELNPPAGVAHTIRLDHHRSGLQTLGAETIVDVWLYSTPEMLKYAYVETSAPLPSPPPPLPPVLPLPLPPPLKEEPLPSSLDAGWLAFFSEDAALPVDDMLVKSETALEMEKQIKAESEIKDEPQIKEEPIEWAPSPPPPLPPALPPATPRTRIMKYMEPATGRVYYLQVDRDLDLSTAHEIVIGDAPSKTPPPTAHNGTKRQMSLLKPEVKKLLSDSARVSASFKHIDNDHCYLGSGGRGPSAGAGEAHLTCLRSAVRRLAEERTAVYYLLRRLPLVDARAADPEFRSCFPFVVDSEERYWKLDFAKRRNMEWSRAKLVSRLLAGRPSPWRCKQVLRFGRRLGLHPARPSLAGLAEDEWSSWRDLDIRGESNMRELYQTNDISSLTLFRSELFDTSATGQDSVPADEEVDVVGGGGRPREGGGGGGEAGGGGEVLSPEGEERLLYVFVENACADVGIELRNEDIGHGYMYSAVHAVLLSALRSFAEELLRGALAVARGGGGAGGPLWTGWTSSNSVVSLEHVYQAAGGPPPPAGPPGSGPPSADPPESGSSRLSLLCARALAAERKDTYAV